MSPEEKEALTRIELLSGKVDALEEADNEADRVKWKIVLTSIGGMFTIFALVLNLMWPVINIFERFVTAYEEQADTFKQISIDTKSNAINNAAIFKYIQEN